MKKARCTSTLYYTFAPVLRYIILKNVISFTLLILFSIAFSYETCIHFSKKWNGKVVSEINDTESDSSESDQDDKDEKKDIFEDLYCTSDFSFTVFFQSVPSQFYYLNFPISDFKPAVYCPPEHSFS